MSYNILVLLANNVEEIEFVTPIDLWRRSGYTVTIASIDHKLSKTGQQRIKFDADILLSELSLECFDCIYIPGGSGVKFIKDCRLAMETIDYFVKKNKIICAICAAPTIISDYLSDKNATCYPSLKSQLKNWIDQAVVIDGNFITSQSAGTAHLLAFELIKLIENSTKTEELKIQTVFNKS